MFPKDADPYNFFVGDGSTMAGYLDALDANTAAGAGESA